MKQRLNPTENRQEIFINILYMKSLSILFAVTALTLWSCGSNNRQPSTTATPALPAPADDVDELPLPDVPSSLIDPADRASYIVEHFWDAMDFGDTIRSLDEDFMEQNFANYASLFPYVDVETAESSIRKLMNAASDNREAYNLLADIADKYLYDSNSPMMDEEAYILFLKVITEADFVDRDRRIRFESQLNDALKNRRGSRASDFGFVDSHGSHGSLYGTADGKSYRLVMFYDPDCEVCKSTKEMLSGNIIINNAVASGLLKVIAVYSDGDNEVWEKSKNDLPGNWMSVCSPEGAVDRDEVYVIRATPTLYLLAPDNTVVLKDARAEEIIGYLTGVN